MMIVAKFLMGEKFKFFRAGFFAVFDDLVPVERF